MLDVEVKTMKMTKDCFALFVSRHNDYSDFLKLQSDFLPPFFFQLLLVLTLQLQKKKKTTVAQNWHSQKKNNGIRGSLMPQVFI